MYNVQCTVYTHTTHCPLYWPTQYIECTGHHQAFTCTSRALITNHCELHRTALHFTVDCRLNMVYCMLYSVHCTLYIVPLYTVPLCTIHCTAHKSSTFKVHYVLLDIVNVVSSEYEPFSFTFAVCFLLQSTVYISTQCRTPRALDPYSEQ